MVSELKNILSKCSAVAMYARKHVMYARNAQSMRIQYIRTKSPIRVPFAYAPNTILCKYLLNLPSYLDLHNQNTLKKLF